MAAYRLNVSPRQVPTPRLLSRRSLRTTSWATEKDAQTRPPTNASTIVLRAPASAMKRFWPMAARRIMRKTIQVTATIPAYESCTSQLPVSGLHVLAPLKTPTPTPCEAYATKAKTANATSTMFVIDRFDRGLEEAIIYM